MFYRLLGFIENWYEAILPIFGHDFRDIHTAW